MKKLMIVLSATTVLGLFPANSTNAATGPCATTPTTQVYDLKADWSDTQNPNGTWSYRLASDGSLLPNWWFPWGYPHQGDTLMRTTEAEVVPRYRELGDVLVAAHQSGVIARWTAPARGTISISGASWDVEPVNPDDWEQIDYAYDMRWSLTHNGTILSEGTHGGVSNRSSPADLSLGSGGMNALLNVPVEAGGHVELALWSLSGEFFGVNFTITLTTDSAGSFAEDAIIWHQPLARSGASEDTDPSAGRTVKYRFKRGSTIPIQIHALGCDGGDVTPNANVIATVTVFGDSNCDGAADANAEPIEFNGVGGGGGVMDKIDGHLKYNLDTKSLPTTTQCYILRVTVSDTSTGEEKFEEVLLQAK